MAQKRPAACASGGVTTEGSVAGPESRGSEYEAWLRESMLPKYAKAFPKAFSVNKAKVKPLAIGISSEIARSGKDELMSFQFKFLRWYCTRPCYLKAVAEGTRRVHLDGSYASDVTEKEREYSKSRFLAVMRQRGLIAE